MAVEIRFNCEDSEDYAFVDTYKDKVRLNCFSEDSEIILVLDITTAIKLSKTIRTEINKAKEVKNV